jgi:hypothetical protein
LVKNTGLSLSGITRRHESELLGAVEECRKEWKEAVVDLVGLVTRGDKSEAEQRFQKDWDFRGEPDLLTSLGARLALAGEKLFASIFQVDCDDGLHRVAAKLRVLLTKPRHLAVTSRSLFIPWGMLYTHPIEGKELEPDGANWDKRGFWGYQHIIQHSPDTFDLESEIRPDAAGKVALSINFDDRLSVALKLPSIKDHIDFVSTLGGTACIHRTTKNQLATVFIEQRATLERILYFYCHGHGSNVGGAVSSISPHLKLKDGNVSASDFQTWAAKSNEPKLPTRPLVIVNACQGGQMTTQFYESFASELLRQGAVGLIGAQIDVPAVFASAYGRLLLEDFFSRDKDNNRLGPLLRSVNQRMWKQHNNPLGLVYSLYRGANCFINWEISS